MYNNFGDQSGPQSSTQSTPFGNPFHGASSGIIRSGLGAYGERILGSSSVYVQSNISKYFSDPQYYFQVSDQYVRNKLKVVLFPFLHRGHWTRITEPVGGRLSYKPPIHDINAPDLYIPFMAFGTYVLLAGFSLGLHGKSKEVCEKGEKSTTSKQWKVEPGCGRPLGLRFNKRSGDLYIADAYHGLLVVGPKGGVATPLVTHVKGRPLLFTNDLDVHENGSIFFTDTSTRYNRVKHFLIMLEGEATGRLLRYDPQTKTTHVVLEGLAFPNGVQLSSDHTFLLYTETTNCRVMKYWLEGAKTGRVEVFADLPGFPDNIRMNDMGEFWVAVDCCRTRAQEVLTHNPWLRSIYFRLPAPMSLLARLMGMRMHTLISRLSYDGDVLETLEDRGGSAMKLVSEVREMDGKLWVGTVAHNHIATLSHPSPLF